MRCRVRHISRIAGMRHLCRLRDRAGKVEGRAETTVSRVGWTPPPISPQPNASILAKSKYHKNIKSFAQATKGNVMDILRIKDS